MIVERIEGPGDMKSRLEHYRELARQRIHPTQDTVAAEGHFIFTENDVLWYGRCPSLMEALVRGIDERVLATAEEMHSVVATARNSDDPEGFAAQVHKSQVWPIEDADYEAAREAGWVWSAIPTVNRIGIEAAQRGLAEHHRRLAEAS